MVCGEEWHGICNKSEACANCGKGHRANDRRCDYYVINKEIKTVMAYDNCSFAQAKEKVSNKRNNTWKNNKEWPFLTDSVNRKNKDKEKKNEIPGVKLVM